MPRILDYIKRRLDANVDMRAAISGIEMGSKRSASDTFMEMSTKALQSAPAMAARIAELEAIGRARDMADKERESEITDLRAQANELRVQVADLREAVRRCEERH